MSAKEVRRTDRVYFHFPIRVSGADVTGHKFTVQARTVSISRFGATIVLPQKLAPGQQLTIRNFSTHRETNVRVVGQIGGQSHGYIYGIALVDSTDDIWKIQFPPLSESGKAVSRLLLECVACHSREVVYLNELEVEVFEANTNLSRPCLHCNDWTVWKQSQHEPKLERQLSEAEQQPPDAEQQPPVSPPYDPTRNKRKSVRVRLKKITACIRQAGFEEEIVQVDDLSRGGLRFRSPKTYYEGSRIEVAVPYEPRAGNIFVLARIVSFRELPGADSREYGAAYIKT